ncbi:hypothetical protein GCM10023084_41630 [Streptomyces lacrimifluminis]|uniref:Uncharacterized protein n=1 Tax=Streptomyces lacrimifluminis TaxID=1500077 RepID=A0A917NYU6_9ACTN|nr:hypothetical protein GCM10012282_43260 [Streptomyces lacrimifluminis]
MTARWVVRVRVRRLPGIAVFRPRRPYPVPILGALPPNPRIALNALVLNAGRAGGGPLTPTCTAGTLSCAT